jgi:hypothetical protein
LFDRLMGLCLVGLVAPVGLSGQATAPPLFAADDPVELTLTADFSLLKGDRHGEAPERPATVRLSNGATIGAEVRTRGNFRRDASNCTFPPLRLRLRTEEAAGTVFEGQDKLKLVASCRPNRSSFQQLVMAEYLVYKAFQLLTSTAFQVRLARITYVDARGEDAPTTRLGFFIEHDDALAARMGTTVFDLEEGKNIPPRFFDPPTAAMVGVFEYMIGNTDWSEVAGHNIELLELAGVAIPVPYDFDFSGIVDAPYASPDPKLGIKEVTERVYRGWCWNGLDMAPVIQRFREMEPKLVELYETFPYLEDGPRRRSLRYLKAFFDGIETQERAQRRFLRDCRQLPTG